jgi:type I restriction enzyme, R subunit
MKPEEQARQKIDELLALAGWAIQDYKRFNLRAKIGVAVREFPMTTGDADYLLFVNGEAVGTIEAKKAGATLTGVEEQSTKYRTGVPKALPAPRLPLPFSYD